MDIPFIAPNVLCSRDRCWQEVEITWEGADFQYIVAKMTIIGAATTRAV